MAADGRVAGPGAGNAKASGVSGAQATEATSTSIDAVKKAGPWVIVTAGGSCGQGVAAKWKPIGGTIAHKLAEACGCNQCARGSVATLLTGGAFAA